MDLYKRENVSPFSGCLSAILQLVIILSVFWLISKPLTYMKKIDSGIIENYKNEIIQESEGKKISNYYEIEIIDKKSAQDDSIKINMNFLSLDLSKVPGQNMNDYKVYIIPALYIVSSIVSMKLMTNKKKDKRKAIGDGTEKTINDEPDMSEQMTKSMSMITPIMAVSIAFIAPLGLALYWFVSNLLMIVERIVITKYVDSKEEKKDA